MSLQKYGSLGAVFTLLSWLITLCVVVTLCLTAGAVVAREPWAARHLGTRARADSPGPASGDTLEAGPRPDSPSPGSPNSSESPE
ncbi:hypothetical protein [Streptomyces sp. T028]|uniref:hypothetical protein n=1 Tax=Streptomyces sp. T028 TaxID=3394379 RepID=UPI003A881A04